MKQVVQKYKTGELRLADVPAPILRPGGVLVANRASLISAGTERMKVEVARKNLIGKALERPDAVKKVIDVARQQGVMQAYEKAMNKLDTLTPLGYSSSGVVIIQSAAEPDPLTVEFGENQHEASAQIGMEPLLTPDLSDPETDLGGFTRRVHHRHLVKGIKGIGLDLFIIGKEHVGGKQHRPLFLSPCDLDAKLAVLRKRSPIALVQIFLTDGDSHIPFPIAGRRRRHRRKEERENDSSENAQAAPLNQDPGTS